MGSASPFRVIIVGAGLGGLSCSIACRHQGLSVLVLEKAPAITAIGAGIQVPPNAGKILQSYGLLPLFDKPAVQLEWHDMRRYRDGQLLASRPVGEQFIKQMGAPWMVIHRQDYHAILLGEAKRLGAEVKLDANVTDLNFDRTEVILSDGEVIKADVIIGADGLWSSTRDAILGHPSPPVETGDLAYRATFSRQQLSELNDPRVEELCAKKTVTLWMGPDKHCVFYPVRGGAEFNLVLLRPDNLPTGVRTVKGDLDEMRMTFEGWDEILVKLISCISSVLKWKLCHHQELEKWTRDHIALLGDACHPTLPYQAQGAAMAVEDGAVLGFLLGQVAHKSASNHATLEAEDHISAVLRLYEKLRKSRTTVNVLGAVTNRKYFHLHDGPEQEERDAALASLDWYRSQTKWKWIDSRYQEDLLGFDALKDAEKAFKKWWAEQDTARKGG
ncbi:FAD binding domain-containing protein [Cladophialophora immunda]|nr:FAD binding domain-containing protein [Cladophialophora immunda]